MESLSGSDTEEISPVERAFRRALDGHGYGFHYAVLRRAEELCATSRSQWRFEVAEFPVVVQKVPTRIDIVLRHGDEPLLLVGECKRVNPALGHWCFATAPYVATESISKRFIVERARFFGAAGETRAGPGHLTTVEEAYHIAIEIRSPDTKGDPSDKGRGAIEEAVSQVFRGVNGMMEYLGRNPQLVQPKGLFIIPVVFTTAALWSTNVALDRSSLADGKVDFAETSLTRRNWLLYQYHVSPGIKHEVAGGGDRSSLSKSLASDFARSVAIVSSNGIDEFLTWSSHLTAT
jgi:hypothetical protein